MRQKAGYSDREAPWWPHLTPERLVDDESGPPPSTPHREVIGAFRSMLPAAVDTGLAFVLDATRRDALTVARRRRPRRARGGLRSAAPRT